MDKGREDVDDEADNVCGIEFPVPAARRPKLNGFEFYDRVLGAPKYVVRRGWKQFAANRIKVEGLLGFPFVRCQPETSTLFRVRCATTPVYVALLAGKYKSSKASYLMNCTKSKTIDLGPSCCIYEIDFDCFAGGSDGGCE